MALRQCATCAFTFTRIASNAWPDFYNDAIPLTSLYELELINTIYLKQFRSELTTEESRLIMLRFESKILPKVSTEIPNRLGGEHRA